MKLSAKQYIGWALHDLVEYAGFKPIRSELPDLYGQLRLFDAAVVANRPGRYSIPGLLVALTMFVLALGQVDDVPFLVRLAGMMALAGAGWVAWRWPGLAAGAFAGGLMLMVSAASWIATLKWIVGVLLAFAGWTALSTLGAVLGGALGLAVNLVPANVEFPVWLQVCQAGLGVISAYAWLSTSAVVVAVKAADDLSFPELMSELERLGRLIPGPGAVDAFEYYGGLVLVFEKPVAPAKRDRLISLRRTSLLGRMVTDIWVVELDAGTMYALDVPWNVRGVTPLLEDALSRRGDPPAWTPPEPSIGQRSARTGVAYATIGLVTANVLVHLLVHTDYDESSLLRLVRAGASHSELGRIGQTYRWVSHMFLHGDWGHLVGNMIGLLEAGRGVEQLFGAGWLMVIYLVTGLCGELLSETFLETVSVGASGAVFGIGGVLVSVYVFRGRRLSVRYRSHLLVAGAMLVLNLIRGFSTGPSVINNWAHLGGFLGGLAFGLVLPFKREDGPAPWRGGLWGTACVIVCLLAAGAVVRNWHWAPASYTSVRLNGPRVVVERPEGWSHGRSDDGADVLDNGAGARVIIVRGDEDIRGLFFMPLHELRDFFERRLRSDLEEARHVIRHHWQNPGEAVLRRELVSFGASFLSLSGGTALSIRFDLEQTLTVRHYFLVAQTVKQRLRVEEIYLPLDGGYLWLLLASPAEDADYYQPVFARIKATFKSLDPPSRVVPPREARE